MSRRPSDAAGSVLSFTFLDVLMCTMGSLLLLLVLFGVIMKKGTRLRREGEETKLSLELLAQPNATKPPTAISAEPESADLATAEDPAELARKLQELRQKKAEAEKRLREAADLREQEEARVTHLEEHERRLEHDLAKLHYTLQALEAAEEQRSVDQEQAAADAKRLKDLIRDTEAQLDEMRKAGGPPKSYAIVPYKGANGTFRRPVFVECTATAVTIQPEGIVLTVADFDGPLRSGNPLAAAIRAAHEELNRRAVAAGQSEMPDPYPLLIVRPDGAGAYAAALDAISSWEADYGYEFVEADWKLAYPEADPRLGQVMEHAVAQARERQALLARAAPRRYASRLSGGRGGAGLSSTDGDAGATFDDLVGGDDDRIGAHSAEGALGEGGGGDGGNSLRRSNRYGSDVSGGARSSGNFSDEFVDGEGLAVAGATTGSGEDHQFGGRGNGTGGPGSPGSYSNQTAAGAAMSGAPNGHAGDPSPFAGPQDSAPNAPSGVAGATGSTQGAPAGAGAQNAALADAGAPADGNAASGSSAGSSMASSGNGSSAGAAGNASAASITAGQPGIQPVKIGNRSAANSRGSNWANAAAARRAAPITRPVKVVVTRDQLAVLDGDSRTAAATITFQQPVDGVLDQLAAAVQQQVKDWGLAGADMYWRPTLVVSIAPGADRQAARLAELLDDSGLDVRLPQTATAASSGAGRATR